MPGANDHAMPSTGEVPTFEQPPLNRGTGHDLNEGYGSGRTALIPQYYDSTDSRYEFTGDQNIDGVLIGSKWTTTSLTFSFPSSGSFYTDGTQGTESAEHVVANAAQQAGVRYALSLVGQYTNMSFFEVSETATTHANLRFSQTNDDSVGSAYGNFPSSSARAGDIWFGRTGQPFYDTPARGNWGLATIMHELGHTLGLKHGHQDYTNTDLAAEGYIDAPSGGGSRYGSAALPSNHDGQDWSLMTYRSDPAASVAFEGDGFNQPQTYMQNDIAALQHLYGANFNTNSGATTYTWSQTTGEMSINGVGQGAPTSNKILMTIWDGDGVDTYDLTNYTTSLSVDLRPGAFSTFSTAQLVNHRPVTGGSVLATGNVANALLFNNDIRSLIDNANGGTNADSIIGNQIANTLRGNAGADTLIGDAGSDKLYGGSENDQLYGDGRAAGATGVGMGSGILNKPSGAGNVDIAHAIDVTNLFSLASNNNIANSTTSPHVSVSGTADGHVDFYKLTVAAGTILTFDVDATSGFDSFLKLFGPSGTELFLDDDSLTTDGGGGSTATTDSFLTYTVQTAGVYYIGIGDYLSSTNYEPIAAGNTYQLQISVTGAPATGGGNGNDTLDGGSGADSMYGGAGSDIYYVDNAGDKVFESNVAGTDLVYSAVSFKLGSQYIENLTLTGSANIDATGNSLANVLTGNSGANVLNGSGGADTMIGGAGADTYYVDNAGDRITEGNVAGIDLVYSSVSIGLGSQYIENVTLMGTANINATGNSLANVLTGNSGKNILNGSTGADTMAGGAGADTYYVDNAGDKIIEGNVAGTDLVYSTVSISLGSQYVENVALTGTAAINATGNSLANKLVGNSGANVLNGSTGLDTMTGGAGADKFWFSTAASASNVDHITDFKVVDDTIQISRSVFSAITGTGTLTSAQFVANATGTATNTNQHIIYNTSNGQLFYDTNGSTAGGSTLFAVIDNHATAGTLTNADFLIV